MTKIGHNSTAEKLRQYIAQLEQLEIEKNQISEHIKDVYTVAKSMGFDTKTMRQVLKLRKLDSSKREEQEHLLDTYLHALGMLPLFEGKDKND
jgi:uncharacterized protein (UPF0335 family)